MNISEVKEIINQSFNNLEFEEGRHIYRVQNKVLTSTSNMIKKFVPEFKEKEIAANYAKKTGVKVNDVLTEWENKRVKAATSGTRVHLFSEKYIESQEASVTCRQEEAAKNFIDDYIVSGKFTVIATELQMYSDKYGYAGTADLLLWNNELEELVIGDYKTNQDLDKQYGYLLEPFSYTPNTPYCKYQIQLSFYQILLESIGLKVSKRMIIWLKKDSSYQIRYCSDFTEVLKESLNTY